MLDKGVKIYFFAVLRDVRKQWYARAKQFCYTLLYGATQ